MFKKILLIGISLISLQSVVLAENNPTTDESWTTIEASYLDFDVHTKEGKAEISWNANALTLADDESWQYRKVLKSQTNSNPLYPDLDAIKYSPDRSFSSHTDRDLLAGKTYYRVCAITRAENKKRYCSSVKTIQIDASDIENKEEKKVLQKTSITKHEGTSTLSQNLQDRIDLLFEKFLDKLDTQYEGNAEEKIARLEKIISRLSWKTSDSPKIQAIFTYFQDKAEEYIALLEIEAAFE